MNGLEKELVDRRPLVTCAGELEVFSPIEDNLLQSLPKDSAEWKRTLGRPVRSVHIGANFVPFSSVGLPKGSQWDLIRQPLFHIYWTECNDVDLYRSTLKEDIEGWLKELTSRDIQDWLIVVVENYDGKRANKLLPRTTVLDKIRADFALKQGDRCISVINPGKSDTTESWKGLVNRIRHLLLVAYSKAVSRLEDHVRQQREKRNEPGWKFMNYFHLQEELAQVLEMLGLYDEALVQYDELDALFSQFVVNGVTCESVAWLSDFQTPLERWHALKLGPSQLINNPSILELRAYLFANQAHMLLLIDKVWQMAFRCLPFLHTCTRELSILEIPSPPGALDCWLFLASMEVLQTCDKFNHAGEVEAYSKHTASLWAYASQKLKSLGELCGLLPGSTPTSEQLHIVVGLSAGMGDNPGTPIAPSPTDKLKEALCSQDAFNKTYLELAELSMGTYKHTGRARSARLVGREIAAFYLLLGETQKAAAFLSDASRLFRQDGWNEVAAHTEKELADCYKQANDWRKYIRCCAHVASAVDLDTLVRWTYFDGMRKYIDKLDKPLVVPFSDIIKIISISVKNLGIIMQDSNIELECVVESNFPREILCSNIMVSLENEPNKRVEKYCKGRTLTEKDLRDSDMSLRKLKIVRHLDYKQDKQLSSVSVICKLNELKRKDSTPPVHSDFRRYLEGVKLPFLLTPGTNLMRLSTKATQTGKYILGQMSIHIGQLQLISQPIVPRLSLEVEEEGPSLRLYKNPAPLLSGLEQAMNLILTIGSYPVDPTLKVKLNTSRGLTLQISHDAPLTNSCEFEVGKQEVFSSVRRELRVMADMLSKDHQVTILCPWNPKPIVVSLSFTPPLMSSWKLLTVKFRKFVQISLTGQCQTDINIEKPRLITKQECEVLNRNDNIEILQHGHTYILIWEVILNPKLKGGTLNAEFNITYSIKDIKMEPKLYQYFFDISDYETLYILDATLEPAKGNEFCRIGSLCHLNLTIKNVGNIVDNNVKTKSIMYEVLAEQSVWAVCGRTAGVVSFESDVEPDVIVLDIMPLTVGYLPLPLVRISKYIPAEGHSGKNETHPRLEPFSAGQVYNATKGKQVHVIATPNDNNL
ncbi:trafficking protein particle complex subunit 10 [Harmonia axyridis]|uniref:trafficking protein particle complex subunit 10 n=1 Tax=Harmonia axyridis TaxID=115357 RepID=UPI001E276DFC|nr:trafficking protein particle complex subunit 10 [Harmonia axyridis]